MNSTSTLLILKELTDKYPNMNNQSSNGFLIGVIIVVLIAVVGFLAYKQGYFSGRSDENNTNGIELNIGGNNDSAE